MYSAMSLKTVCCEGMEVYYPLFMGVCFIMEFLLFGVYSVPVLYRAEM